MRLRSALTLIRGLAFMNGPARLIQLKRKHLPTDVWTAGGFFTQINDSLSSTDDPVAATPLFIYRNKGDGYDWPSPPNELAFILPSCAHSVSLCSLWNSHFFITFWDYKEETKTSTLKFFPTGDSWVSPGFDCFLARQGLYSPINPI